MVQTTLGIMWGVRAPKGVALTDYDNDETDRAPGLLCEWKVQCAKAIAEHDAKRSSVRDRIRGRGRYVPDVAWPEGERVERLVGFWVAVGASGKDGVPYLGGAIVAMTRSGVREVYPRGMRNAVARWGRFRRWCAAGRDPAGCDYFATTAPSLWLVPTEVA